MNLGHDLQRPELIPEVNLIDVEVNLSAMLASNVNSRFKCAAY